MHGKNRDISFRLFLEFVPVACFLFFIERHALGLPAVACCGAGNIHMACAAAVLIVVLAVRGLAADVGHR
jgi:hypothetical protein